MSRALGTAYNFKQKVKTTGRAFMQWKMFAHFGRLRRQHLKMVEKHSRVSYFKKAWNSWAANHNETKKKKIEETKKREAEEYVEMISMKYQKEISTLQAKLSETMAELHTVTQNKKEMQNQLKRAFMRGLCAMNLEAMDVLNPEEANELGISNILKDDTMPSASQYKPLGQLGHKSLPMHNGKQSLDSNPISTTARIVNPEYTSTSRLGQPDFAGLLPSQQKEVNDKFNSIDLFMQQSMKRDYPTLHQDEINVRNHEHPTRLPESSASRQYNPNAYRSNLPNFDVLDSRHVSSTREAQLIGVGQSQDIKVQADNVDDMYENMLREFREREERVAQESGLKEENKKVTILREPLAESKEHLWKQAPVVSKKPTSDVEPQVYNPKQNFPVPTQISTLYSNDSTDLKAQPKSILKKKTDDFAKTESDREQDKAAVDSEEEDEGQVIRFDQEDVKKSMQFSSNPSHVSKQTKAPASNPAANQKKPIHTANKQSSSGTTANAKPVSNSIANRIQKKNNL